MGTHRIAKGLDIPLDGRPEQEQAEVITVGRCALVAADYVGLKPGMRVEPGQIVKRGQPLFEDKQNPGVVFTAPGAGTVAALHRGDKRAFLSIVIELNDRERSGTLSSDDFYPFAHAENAGDSSENLRALLIESGLWTALRARPYGHIPPVDAMPAAIFVTAGDTQPLAPPVSVVMDGRDADLREGLRALTRLTEGTVYFCVGGDWTGGLPEVEGIRSEVFLGPHPSGLPGTHIHFLEPVSRDKTVWYIGLQDVLAIGALLRTGRLEVSRIISLAGPGVARPRYLRTRLGASVNELAAGALKPGPQRVLSGSVLGGRGIEDDIQGYLGRYHQQICVLPEGGDRHFMGWLAPGANTFSLTRLFASRWLGRKTLRFDTSAHGSDRAMVPMGYYERVMPLDILPTFLLRSLIAGDLERAEQLGCLELEEDDLALCTFVCPGKTEYGPILRRGLTIIEEEG